MSVRPEYHCGHEILYAAGIYPARPANSLEQKDWERLAAVIPSKNGNWMLCKEYNTKRKEITFQKFKM